MLYMRWKTTVRVLHVPVPREASPEQGREIFHDRAASNPSLAGGADSQLPGKKCQGNWATGGAVAHKRSELRHNRGHFALCFLEGAGARLESQLSSLSPHRLFLPAFSLALFPVRPCPALLCRFPGAAHRRDKQWQHRGQRAQTVTQEIPYKYKEKLFYFEGDKALDQAVPSSVESLLQNPSGCKPVRPALGECALLGNSK